MKRRKACECWWRVSEIGWEFGLLAISVKHVPGHVTYVSLRLEEECWKVVC